MEYLDDAKENQLLFFLNAGKSLKENWTQTNSNTMIDQNTKQITKFYLN